jgi:hypothetical protein
VSTEILVQAVGWGAAAWLLVDQIRLRRGRPPGAGHRAAEAAAAATVIAFAVLDGLWPVAAIGLLWLRAAVFRHVAFHAHLPAPHLPHPDARQQNLILRIELVVVVVAIAIMLSGWVAEQLDLFNRRADSTLCRLMEDGC